MMSNIFGKGKVEERDTEKNIFDINVKLGEKDDCIPI